MVESFFLKFGVCIVLVVSLFVFLATYLHINNNNIYHLSNTFKYYFLAILIAIYLYVGYYSYLYTKEYVNYRKSDVVVKIIGHQWYWNIKYINENIRFDIINGDNIIVLPANKVISILVTSADVIHGVFVPDLNINIEGIQGKINESRIIYEYLGEYEGFCNVLCGEEHTMMPIIFKFVDNKEYEKWLDDKKI